MAAAGHRCSLCQSAGGRGAYGYARLRRQGKPILLVDNPVQNAEVQSFLQGLASVGTEILYTCRENKMQCNQIVNL